MTELIRVTDYDRTNPGPKHLYLTLEEILQWVADRFVWAAYASMDDPDTGITSLGAAWTDIRTYASNIVPPRGITVDLTNGTMAFAVAGVYELNVSVGIEGHNSSNQGRSTFVRLYNDTDGVGSPGIKIGIGRNVEDTFINAGGLFEISQADIGKEFIIQLGNGSDITSIDLLSVNYEAKSVGEFRDTVINLPQPSINPLP